MKDINTPIKNFSGWSNMTAGAPRASAVILFSLLFFFSFFNRVLALVDINTASLDELQTLTGVGPTYAARIVAARPFSSIEDIKRVSGIGDSTYEKIKSSITVSGGSLSSVTETADDNSSGTGAVVPRIETAPKTVEDLKISVPEYAFAGQSIEFDVEPSEGTGGRLVRYEWNFGDAVTASVKSPTHSYDNPGVYVVVVESYYLKEAKVARQQIQVLPPALDVFRDSSGSVVIKNESDHEMDLSGMKLTGDGDFYLPKYSFLLPGETLTLPVERFSEVLTSPFALVSSSGKLVATLSSPRQSQAPAPRVLSATVSAAKISETSTSNSGIDSEPVNANTATRAALEEVGPIKPSDNPAPVSSKNKWPYLALFGIITTGLVAVYGTAKVT